MCTAICLDPWKLSVIERFTLLGEFVIRGSTVFSSHMHAIIIVRLRTDCVTILRRYVKAEFMAK